MMLPPVQVGGMIARRAVFPKARRGSTNAKRLNRGTPAIHLRFSAASAVIAVWPAAGNRRHLHPPCGRTEVAGAV